MTRIETIPYGSPFYASSLRLREEVLRKPIGMALRPQDTVDEENQIHVAALDESGAVVGTALLKPCGSKTFKLRQMAVADPLRGRGLGARLMRAAEAEARAAGAEEVFMVARLVAEGFYAKLGYSREGETFIEVGLPSVIMRKRLPRD
jgi:N-acetylglutamate synthase-like GNAT family acetyltransferase